MHAHQGHTKGQEREQKKNPPSPQKIWGGGLPH